QAAPLEEPLDERHRDHDPDDLRAEVREEVPGGGVRPTRKASQMTNPARARKPPVTSARSIGGQGVGGSFVEGADAPGAPGASSGTPDGSPWVGRKRVTEIARSLPWRASATSSGGRAKVPGPRSSEARR